MDISRIRAADWPSGHRPCVKCGRVMAETRENFYFRKDSGRFREECKECFRLAKKARYTANPEKYRGIARQSYRQPEGDTKKGIATKRRNRIADPERYRGIMLRYEAAHADERKAERVRRHVENKEEANAASKAWYYANADRSRATSRAWQIAHPEQHRYSVERTRMRRKAAYRSLTLDEWKAIWEQFGGLCAYCGAPAEEMDHLVPISKGGDHTAENVVPACFSCNRSKSGKWPDDWLREQAQTRP